jgi:hypothetical protein
MTTGIDPGLASGRPSRRREKFLACLAVVERAGAGYTASREPAS